MPSTLSSGARRPAKFSLPPQPPDFLRRARLLDFLHQNSHRKLLLILAAAGYGKTALVADFAHDTDFPVAWLRLDETDRDLAALVSDLVAALQHAFPGFLSVVPALAAQPTAGPDELAAALNHELEMGLDRYFVLVLDDFQLVEDAEAIIQFFDVLLDRLPEQAHLVILGRTIPAFHIAALAAAQQVAGLSEEHLRFTSEEVQALIQLRNRLAVPDDEAEQLVSNTEGWITGILLTTQLMWQGLIASLIQARQSDSPLYDYLAAEVLDQQPARLRQFMLEAAALPDMEPSVCDAVLGRTDSADMLRQVETRRLFINVVGEELRAYQYHNLFRDFLLARLRARDPERLKTLQVRAAEWYAANGMTEAAVTFYVMAGALAPAGQLAEAEARVMYDAGRHTTLARWGEQLATIAYEVPTLYLYLSKAGADAGDLASAEAKLAVAADGFVRRGDATGGLRVEIQRGQLLYRRGQFESALTIVSRSGPGAGYELGGLGRQCAHLYEQVPDGAGTIGRRGRRASSGDPVAASPE